MASRRLANAGSELSLGRFGLNLMVLVRDDCAGAVCSGAGGSELGVAPLLVRMEVAVGLGATVASCVDVTVGSGAGAGVPVGDGATADVDVGFVVALGSGAR